METDASESPLDPVTSVEIGLSRLRCSNVANLLEWALETLESRRWGPRSGRRDDGPGDDRSGPPPRRVGRCHAPNVAGAPKRASPAFTTSEGHRLHEAPRGLVVRVAGPCSPSASFTQRSARARYRST